ncbi:unnamed protein product [Hymenolepis diminuta]|uniref:Transmembrane protein n=1 Tax=Hymenolepis diminuta TaxID=6216 RepID=A0A0R3SYU5_HYMDI|nr:unnamed protein product [Hymenolepis diminuta]
MEHHPSAWAFIKWDTPTNTKIPKVKLNGLVLKMMKIPRIGLNILALPFILPQLITLPLPFPTSSFNIIFVVQAVIRLTFSKFSSPLTFLYPFPSLLSSHLLLEAELGVFFLEKIQ